MGLGYPEGSSHGRSDYPPGIRGVSKGTRAFYLHASARQTSIADIVFVRTAKG